METNRDTPRPNTATSHDGPRDSRIERLSVPEAAERLGISASAVRKRVERGNLPADKDDDGRLFVYLDTEEVRRATVRDTSHEKGSLGFDELLEELREQNMFLREELATRNEELRRKDTILMTMAQRIPELEPREPQEGPVRASESASSTPPPPEQQEGSERPWWRRFFGLE